MQFLFADYIPIKLGEQKTVLKEKSNIPHWEIRTRKIKKQNKPKASRKKIKQ